MPQQRFDRERDREFESPFLQRGVNNEPGVRPTEGGRSSIQATVPGNTGSGGIREGRVLSRVNPSTWIAPRPLVSKSIARQQSQISDRVIALTNQAPPHEATHLCRDPDYAEFSTDAFDSYMVAAWMVGIIRYSGASGTKFA